MSNLKQNLRSVRTASLTLLDLDNEKINAVLLDLAEQIAVEAENILAANKKDLEKMDSSDPKYDRLLLNKERLQGVAGDIRNVASLDSPVGRILDKRTMDNGLEISKVTVPFGVIGIIYEARPNVTFDVFSLCFKSGNACVLKGGSDAEESNKAIVGLIHKVLEKNNISTEILYLLPNDREVTTEMMQSVGYIDVIIPRGSRKLIDFVRDNARVPVIETGAGIVHTYVDSSADIEIARSIVMNAKTRRVSVCNALDTLIIDEAQLDNLQTIVSALPEYKVEIFADEKSFQILQGKYPENLLHQATEESFGTELLSYKMSIKTVDNIEEALAHIAKYSSKHTEAIISTDQKNIDHFLTHVDAGAVYANTSTAFTDGAQFGLGTEIGISTQKLHARGPMALEALTSYKWIVRGNGQIRPK